MTKLTNCCLGMVGVTGVLSLVIVPFPGTLLQTLGHLELWLILPQQA